MEGTGYEELKYVDQELLFCGLGTTYGNVVKGILALFISFQSLNNVNRFGE